MPRATTRIVGRRQAALAMRYEFGGHASKRLGVREPTMTKDDGPALRQHHPHAVHGRRAAGELRPPGHADGAGAGRLLPVAALPALRSRAIRSGPIATASCCRSATPPCCSTRMLHLTGVKAVNPEYETLGRAVGDAGGHQALPPARQQVSRATPSIAGRPASRRRPGRWARAWRRASAWRSPSGWLAQLLQPAGLRPVRLRRLRAVRRRLHDGGHLRRGRLAGRAPQALEPVLDLRQQPHHHRGQHGAGVQRGRGHPLHRLRLERHPRRRRQRSRDARAGLRRRSRTTTDRPTLIIVDSHIAYGAPHKQDTSAAHGEPLGEEEIRLAKRNYGWPEDAKFLVPDGVREHFAAGIGERGQATARRLVGQVRRVQQASIPSWPTSGYRMQRRELPDGWDKGLAGIPRGSPKAWRPATRRARC